MQILVPDYYNSFRCIASRCRHNCCIGWEIDIDEDTLSLYDDIGGELGDRLKKGIDRAETPHFILENERCPFLNRNGLCDIITELGDGALCDICADHPRYRNYFSDRLEMGLGLCCEEAARLILSKTDKTELLDIDTGEKAAPYPERQKIINILQNRDLSFEERLGRLKTFSDKDYSPLFFSLERLDREWEKYISLLKEPRSANLSEFDTAFEQLAVYFVLRHTAEDFENGLLFSLFSVYIIRKICSALKTKNGSLSFSQVAEICRLYSSEIEYSDENIEKIMVEAF
ncbi:MAG: flagellin lysine-N-methylase [Clostridia bacterium]|nr:flagellin lysine-N-methylase [Clostridia bacterium]